jgi:hypothetical protein
MRKIDHVRYEPRSISFLGREGRVKHYGIGTHDRVPRLALSEATREVADRVIPEDSVGFTIAHDATSAGLGLVYWWANDNEIHSRLFASPFDEPGRLEPIDGTAMACVWELEVIDFERKAWLEHVLKSGDVELYLEQSLPNVEL